MQRSTHLAITRHVSSNLGGCELSYLSRSEIDVALASAQHQAYQRALQSLGCRVEALPAQDTLPDAVFVEDVAVVLDEAAILTRPGAESRRAEVRSVAEVLARYRPLLAIDAPGTLDGGDVLRVGRTLYVGQSARSNAAGIAQLRVHTSRWGYEVRPVPIHGCLHLKSAVTQIAESTLLVQPAWVELAAFTGLRRIEVDPGEPQAANALWLGDAVVYPSCFPHTQRRLEAARIAVVPIDMSELQKAEGAVTCCSLLLRESPFPSS
jgi:dimethylargininase